MTDLGQKAQSHEDIEGVRWLYPALDSRSVDAIESQQAVPPPGLVRVRSDSETLAGLRRAAILHQARPLGGAVSAEAHRVAAELRDGLGQPDAPSQASERSPGLGAAVGTAVHRALEHIDLEAEAQAALIPGLEGLEESLAGLVEVDDLPAALDDARGVLEACWNGQLGRRLRDLGSSVVARELDFLAPPTGVDGSAALHYLTGAIDLVYLDPVDGRFVVADFKTDRVAGSTEIAERAASYRGQLLAYARALQQAFDLDCLPRAELWFLRADELVVVPEPKSRGVGP